MRFSLFHPIRLEGAPERALSPPNAFRISKRSVPGLPRNIRFKKTARLLNPFLEWQMLIDEVKGSSWMDSLMIYFNEDTGGKTYVAEDGGKGWPALPMRRQVPIRCARPLHRVRQLSPDEP